MGCVYILVNKDMPGLIKIGYTSKTAAVRSEQISEAIGVPSSFEVAYELPCDQYENLEKEMHIKLAQHRRPNKEFFEYPVDDAIIVLKQLYNERLSDEIQRLEARLKKLKKVKEAAEIELPPVQGNKEHPTVLDEKVSNKAYTLLEPEFKKCKKILEDRLIKSDRFFTLHLPKMQVPCIYNPTYGTLKLVRIDRGVMLCMPKSIDDVKIFIWLEARIYREYFDTIFVGKTPLEIPPGIPTYLD